MQPRTAGRESTREKDYSSVLIRDETKKRLQEHRKTLDDLDMMQERRLATAMVEVCLDDAALMRRVIERAYQVVMQDIHTRNAAGQDSA